MMPVTIDTGYWVVYINYGYVFIIFTVISCDIEELVVWCQRIYGHKFPVNATKLQQNITNYVLATTLYVQLGS